MSDFYTSFCSKILFPLHERLKGHDSFAVRQHLEESQWWSPQQLRDFQFTRLKAFLSHAATTVPYYQRLFEQQRFNLANLQTIDDLASLPFLTKTIIRSNLEDMKAKGASNLVRSNTGGSSGEPLIFFLSKERVSHDVAAKWRATRWWGVDIGDPEVVIWGSPIEHNKQDRVKVVRDKLMRTTLLPAFEMSEAKLDGFIKDIRAIKPRMLFGYPSALSYIARHAENRGTRMNDLGIRVAFVTSEKLYDEQREQIQKVFGCRVANGYGGRDAGFIAHECPAGEMHITAEDIIVEITDSQGQLLPVGQAGEIVVTHLATKDFPFIRYRTGDVGALSDKPCSCGRGLPVLREIQGRATDFVIAQDGTIMHGLALIYVLRDLSGIRSFKIVQESLHLTSVLVVPDDEFNHAVVDKIKQGIARRLGPSVEVNVKLVDDIPAERSGKFRYVQSLVPACASPAPS